MLIATLKIKEMILFLKPYRKLAEIQARSQKDSKLKKFGSKKLWKSLLRRKKNNI